MIKQMVDNEASAWSEIQDIRNKFNPELFNEVSVSSREEALQRGRGIIREVLTAFESEGYTFENVCPGHGPGHMIRDYMNSNILLSRLDVDPKHAFVGLIGGSLHDIGCAVIPRYEEGQRAVRHAEIGALFARDLLEKGKIKTNDAEKILIPYSIAAHTHYRGLDKVICKDGVEREVTPYQDLDASENPIYGIWLPRWIDRLECNGPTFPARHFLTLGEEHEEFDGQNHYNVSFQHHMKPLSRPFAEQVDENNKRNQTMSEHMIMFAGSQTNDSPYGKHDFGFMVEIRDKSTDYLGEIIDSITKTKSVFSDSDERQIRDAWLGYLARNVEPTAIGRTTAEKLDRMFGTLDDESRYAWCNGFRSSLQQYSLWASERLGLLGSSLSSGDLSLPGVSEDIREVIRPNYAS